MLRKSHLRRPLAAMLVIAGGMMMLLALETLAGALLLVIGIIIEVVGMTLQHRDRP